MVEFGFLKPWPQQYAEAAAWLRPIRSIDAFSFSNRPWAIACSDPAIHLGHANRRQWWLVPAAALVPGCLPAQGHDDE